MTDRGQFGKRRAPKLSQGGEYVKNHGGFKDKTWEGTFEVIRETEKALLLWDGTGKTDVDSKWVPRSQIREQNKTNTPGMYDFVMTEWIAKEKGFI